MKKIILIALGILFSVCLFAQHRVIYGTVNVFNNMTLANVVVSAKKAGTKTTTDSLGNFAIVCNEKDVLEFYGKTFYKERIRVRATDDSVKVNMKFLDSPENVEMAVGYGYITKDKATTAVAALTGSRDDFCSYRDIYELISGRCAGVNVNNSSFLPGSEKDVTIRGINSINANGPLYVVDGVTVSEIANIVPCDVKRISFLKDAEASIYGSRGGGGVILIETVKASDLR